MKTKTAKTGGLCYQTASKLVIDAKDKDIILCHGKPILTCPPYKEYGHAWVEINEHTVIDTEVGSIVDSELYYAIGKINPDTVKRYSWHEACVEMLKADHYGPWD